MIDKRELRIGNKVSSPKHDLPIATIQGMATNNIVMLEEVKTYDFFSDIDPIPLTAEWLGKLGFGDEGKNVFTKERLKIGLDDNGGANWVFYFEQHLSLHSMSYVHQLQNLYFALTGEELAIRIPK